MFSHHVRALTVTADAGGAGGVGAGRAPSAWCRLALVLPELGAASHACSLSLVPHRLSARCCAAVAEKQAAVTHLEGVVEVISLKGASARVLPRLPERWTHLSKRCGCVVGRRKPGRGHCGRDCGVRVCFSACLPCHNFFYIVYCIYRSCPREAMITMCTGAGVELGEFLIVLLCVCPVQ